MKIRLIILMIYLGQLLPDSALMAQETIPQDSLDLRIAHVRELMNAHPDAAILEAEKLLRAAKKLNAPAEEGQIYQLLARTYAEQGNYPKGVEVTLEALKIYERLDSPRDICRMYIMLGIIYRYKKSFEKSLEYYQKAEALAQEKNYEELLAAIWGNLGNIYYDTKEYDKALAYHQKSLAIDEKENDEEGMSNSYHNIGIVHRSLGNLQQALEYYDRSIELDRKIGNQRNLAISYIDYAEIYTELRDFNQALENANKALAIAEEVNSSRLKIMALRLLPLIYTSLGDVEEGLRIFKEYNFLNDSLQAETLAEQVAEMQTKYETAQKEKELAQQESKITKQTSSIRQQRSFIIILIIFFLSGLLLSYLLFNRYKLRQKYRRLALENEQFHLAKNLEKRKEIDKTINYFADSLYGKNSEEEILWDIAKNCISRLGLVDCVIYLVDEERGVLVQKAAYGTKNPEDYAIQDPIEIPLGKGVVGSVALKGEAEIISDTSQDPRYIVDEEARLSELAVPIIQQEKVIGVIDSEHPEKDFFKEQDKEALKTIAAICASKLAQAQADAESEKAREAQLEAEQIKKLDQVKSQFFANISHEFRIPLQLILAPLQSKKYPIPRKDTEMMYRNARRLLRLVNQLLDLARIEVGLMPLEDRPVEVCHFIRSIAESFAPLADNKQLNYQIDIPERDYVTKLDPDKLEKIVYNLLSNAFKFTPEGGKISIHVSVEHQENLRLAVSDSGIGIPEKVKSKIFERFYQVDSSQTRYYEGTGIGLSLTKELVDLLGGNIHLDSQEGKGCTFTINLPLQLINQEDISVQESSLTDRISAKHDYAELLPVSADKKESEVISSSELPRILLVEDNVELRSYVKEGLSSYFNIQEAGNGKEGLEKAIEKVPDLVITDIMMPEMDGVSLTKHLREDARTSHIPIVLLTARDDEETKIKGFETGAEQYLVKPFSMDELTARIQALLAQRQRLQEKFGRSVVLEPKEVTFNDRDAEFLEKMMGIIEENMTNEHFGVETLQQEMAMSRMQLHRKLKALTNQSASEFIRNIKLKRAAQILKQPGVQVAEAAYLSGFSHLSYFAKCFKEQFGVAPSAYAKNATAAS